MNKLNESEFYEDVFYLISRMDRRIRLAFMLAWFPMGLWWAKIYYKPTTLFELIEATVILILFGVGHLFVLWALRSGFAEKMQKRV